MDADNKNGKVHCAVCGSSNPLSPKPVVRAYDRQRERAALQSKILNILLVSGDCLFIAMQPILVYMSKVDGKFLFSPVSVNFLTELCKMVFAIAMLFFQARRQRPGESSLLSIPVIVQAAKANVLLAVPAGLYAINNYLKFIMQLYFKPATVKMLSNLKVLTIAVLLKLVMRRHFSILQWEALCLLLIGISINQMPCGQSASEATPISAIAWLYTFFSVTIPSAASVYNEFALKKQFDTSVHLQNLFMYCYGATFNLLFILALQISQGGALNLLQGHSRATMALIANNAMQGILSSFFFKYADTILKKYSSTVATIFTGLASAALFGHAITINFVLGVSVVLISMHQFFSSVAQPRAGPGEYLPLGQPPRGVRNGAALHKDVSLLNMTAGAIEEANHLRPVQSEQDLLLPR